MSNVKVNGKILSLTVRWRKQVKDKEEIKWVKAMWVYCKKGCKLAIFTVETLNDRCINCGGEIELYIGG